jgi:hypothetical protein
LEQVTVEVPRGILDTKTGIWIRRAKIRKLTGLDEQLLLELPASMPLHSQVLAFLEKITTFSDVGEAGAIMRQMSIGDITFLLLSARKLMVDDDIACTARCPSCGKDMSLSISVTMLQQTTRTAAATTTMQPERHRDIEACGYHLRVRPLTPQDQDILLNNPSSDEVVQALARACIIHSQPQLPDGYIPESLLEAIGSNLGEIDPLSDITLNLACPECHHAFHATLPVEAFVLGELYQDRYGLEREVHWLAFHYHWSEQEILSLTREKRKRYVELINATLAGEKL